MHITSVQLTQILTTMQIVKAFKSLVPSIELTNDETRTSHLVGTWTDNQGYRDQHTLSFRYVRNSEKLAAEKGTPNLKTKDDYKKIFVPNSSLADIIIEGLCLAGWEPED